MYNEFQSKLKLFKFELGSFEDFCICLSKTEVSPN